MKRKRKMKGMTLVEVLIALAIMGIMTLFLAKNASVIERYNRATSRLNQKTAIEGPLAETAQTEDIDEALIDSSVSIHVGYNKDDASKYAEVKGHAYSVKDAYTRDDTGIAGNELELKFITID